MNKAKQRKENAPSQEITLHRRTPIILDNAKSAILIVKADVKPFKVSIPRHNTSERGYVRVGKRHGSPRRAGFCISIAQNKYVSSLGYFLVVFTLQWRILRQWSQPPHLICLHAL